LKNCTAELHQHPTELMKRLVREWQRWDIASRQRGGAERNKRPRPHSPDEKGGWAALVYGRALMALRDVAERILREYWTWPQGDLVPRLPPPPRSIFILV